MFVNSFFTYLCNLINISTMKAEALILTEPRLKVHKTTETPLRLKPEVEQSIRRSMRGEDLIVNANEEEFFKRLGLR
jgi:hypothetical protein